MKDYSKYSVSKLEDLCWFSGVPFEEIWDSLMSSLKLSRDEKLCKKCVSFMLSNLHEKTPRADLDLIAEVQNEYQTK